ncbi:MAG: DUF1080 domain-containing protein [Kiritimatiellaeota bacterium]|nr:DUF1080 domain-containing protein [Kiritimatiellota bacterium]
MNMKWCQVMFTFSIGGFGLQEFRRRVQRPCRHAVAAALAVAVMVGGRAFGSERWTPLFDGRTLNGWQNLYDWGKAWVQNREILLQADRKFFLCTERTFRDFVFEAEVRLPDKGHANSGFMFRCHKQRNRVYGYQAEVDPSARAWSGGLYDEGRRGWIWPRQPNDSTAAQEFRQRTKGAFEKGAWNKYRIRCRGDHIEIFVNGIQTTDVRDSTDREGYIALQHHGEKGRIYRFRRIRITELPSPPEPVPVAAEIDLTEHTPARMQNTLGLEPPPGATILLGQGHGVEQWRPARTGAKAFPWKLGSGVLTVVPGTGSILTRPVFSDFRLHVEFNVNSGRPGQANGNSGIYIQQRYEVQILNSFGRPNLQRDECGAIYGFKPPDVNACGAPGAWQAYDIEFRAARWGPDGKKTRNARVAVFQNGIRIHNNVEVPAKTGAGRPEAPTPGPIELQEHGNAVRFRNIWVLRRGKGT